MARELTVFFDGACPLCRREIGWYRRRRGAQRIAWVDVSTVPGETVAPGLCMADALARFHVQLPDGEFVSGGRAFAELWASLPALKWAGHLFRTRWLVPLLEAGYRGFLPVRPYLQRVVRSQRETCPSGYPHWFERDLRSDHAGEAGAVAIYRGILAVTRDATLRDFARHHLETEARHLALMEHLLPRKRRSHLLVVWRSAGFLTGALPALFGPTAVYVTIDAVESFVDRHYAAQLDALARDPEWDQLREQLAACRRDELAHRDEARCASNGERGFLMRLWRRLVGAGSAAGVAVARRV